MENLETTDIQGLIVRGYSEHVAARYFMLKITDANAAKAWLAGTMDVISAGRPKPGDIAVNVAFTFPGLTALGLGPLKPHANFSPEFLGGMVEEHRSRTLGDTDRNAPTNWEWGGPSNPVDLVLMIFARKQESLDASFPADMSFADHGMNLVKSLETSNLGGFEQFGFRDGISQPIIEGLSSREGSPANTIKAGEFILGYANEYGQYTDRPMVDPAADPGGHLPRAAGPSGAVGDLGKNGAYLVFRTLQQDVAGFHTFLDQATMDADHSPNRAARDLLGAKMVGRWPSGAPVVKAPVKDDPALADLNDFAYHADDRFGHRCPIGAHIRRSNPRDSLDPKPGSAESIAIGKHHRILRRGREYGPPYDPQSPNDGIDRGLHFLCLVGSVSRQYEFIQYTWVNNPKFAGLYDDADPLVGAPVADSLAPAAGVPPAGCPVGATFTMQANPIRARIKNVPRFVSVRGGAYFFMPGMKALRYLSTLP